MRVNSFVSIALFLLTGTVNHVYSQTFTQRRSTESDLRVRQTLQSFKKIRNPNRVLQALDSLGASEGIEKDSLRAAVMYYRGSALGQINAFDSSLNYLNRSLEVTKGKGFDELEIFTYIAFGNVFWARQYLSLSLEYYQRGLDLCSVHDEVSFKQIETLLLNNIAGVYGRMEDFENGLKYALQANENLLKTDPSGKAPRNYLKLGTYLNELHRPAEALERLKIGEKQAIETGDSIALSHIHAFTGQSYYLLHDLPNAEKFNIMALNDSKAVKLKFAFPYINLASVYLARGDYRRAQENLKVGYSLATELGELTDKKKAIELAYEISLKQKNFSRAIDHSTALTQLNDSIKSNERARQVEEIQIRYETEKKEQQIKELAQSNLVKDLETQSANQRLILVAIALSLALVVVVVLWNRFTIKQQATKALDEKNLQLEKLNGFKDRMFAVISHDLRNPVDAFNTIIESLNQNLQYATKEELKEFLESTLQSAKDLKSLLNNLLEWSLVQIGKLPFHPAAVPVSDIVTDSASHIETMAAAKQIQIRNNISADKKVLVDRSMLTIVLRNVLSNAVKFSHSGKTVELSAQQTNGTIQISIRDQGIGMNPEEVAKLFRMEENTHTIGTSIEKGAGIGLLLCKELMERNKGFIDVESQPGKGTTFYLQLPSA